MNNYLLHVNAISCMWPVTVLFAGESSIDFLFDFLEVSQSLLGGFDVVDNRPRAGKRNRIMPYAVCLIVFDLLQHRFSGPSLCLKVSMVV